MTKAKKKSLMLIIAIALVMFFVVSMIGMSAVSEKPVLAQSDANNGDIATGTEGDINIGDIMINGNVPANYLYNTYGYNVETPDVIPTKVPNSRPIKTVDDLKNFLQGAGNYSTITTGYLVNNISGFSWDKSFTNILMAEGRTLDGAGFEINLNATALNTSPWTAITGTLRENLLNTFIYDTTYGSQFPDNTGGETCVDLHGGLVGYIPPNSTIKNTNFSYTGTVEGYYSSQESGMGGVIAGFSNGKITNCSLTMATNSYLDIEVKGARRALTGHKEQQRHSFAIGGYVGAMAGSYAEISNSKITINESNHKVYIDAKKENVSDTTPATLAAVRSGYSDSHVRLWGGGMVGWMANGSKVYNVTTAGNGNVMAYTGEDCNNPLSYSGIVAGCCAVAEVTEQTGMVGPTSSQGTIDGVINTWTGKAVYYMATATFAPSFNGVQSNHNEIASQICGLSGVRNSSISTVSNVYFMYDHTKVNGGYSSITGYNYATGTCGMDVTRIDIYDYNDEKNEYENVNGTAKAQNAYMMFSDTTDGASLLAVYSIDLQGGVLWQMQIDLNANDPTGVTPTSYYDKITSIEEASKYSTTYTEIERKHNTPVSIKYQLGQVIKYTINVDGLSVDTPEKVMSNKAYDGKNVEIPSFTINVGGGKSNVISDVNFWMAQKEGTNQIIPASQAKDAGTYKYFVYNGDGESAIDFLDTTNRYVAYRKDNDYYTSKENPGATDWQPKLVQTIDQREVTIDFQNLGADSNNIVYDGERVEFVTNLANVVSGESVSANLVYYYLDMASETPVRGDKVVDNAAINAGNYRAVVESISDSNYTFAGADTTDNIDDNPYADFVIEKREVKFYTAMSVYNDEETSALTVDLPYNGLNQELTYDIVNEEGSATSTTKSFAVYNIIDKDKSVIKITQSAIEGSIYDTVNVGTFKVVASLASGSASDNYYMPQGEVELFVNIVPTSNITITVDEGNAGEEGNKYHTSVYAQNYTINAVANGVNGESFKVQSMIVKTWNGEAFEGESNVFPSSAGKYEITYVIDNNVYKNYATTYSQPVVYEITKRVVHITFDREAGVQQVVYNGDYQGVGDNEIASFQKQDNELNQGLINFHAKDAYLEYQFIKKGETQVLADSALGVIDAGQYVVQVQLKGIPAVAAQSYQLVYEEEEYIFTILPKPISVNVNNATKVYTYDEPEYSWSYADESNIFYERDNIVLSLYTDCGQMGPAFDAEGNPVSYPIKWYQEQSTGNLSNYEITVNEGELTVTPININVVITVDNNAVTYGTLPEMQITYADDNRFHVADKINIGAVVENNEDATVLGVGSYNVIATGNYVDNKNYIVNVTNATFDVVPKDITIKEVSTEGGVSEFEYSGEIIKPQLSVVFSDGDIVGEDVVGLVYDYYQGDNLVDAINVGTYTAVISGVDNANYNLVLGDTQLQSVEFSIIKRVVNVNVNDAKREYGLANITCEGNMYTLAEDSKDFADADINSGRIVVALASDVALDKGTGDYADGVYIVITGDAVDNYTLNIVSKGTLTITGTNIGSIYLKADSTVYDTTDQFGKIQVNVAEGVQGYTVVVKDKDNNIVTEAINAGTYYVTISAVEGSQFSGEPVTREFVIKQAPLTISVDDINMIINYNKLTFESSLAGISYSVNDDAFVKRNIFEANALTTYNIKAKAGGEGTNYLESNVIDFSVTTGINTTSIISFLESTDSIGFGDINAYKTMLEQLEQVGADDKASIDYDKVNALKASYEALLEGAQSVIGDAQTVAGSASGMGVSGKVSLVLSSLGLGLAGVLLSISAKKANKENKRVAKINKKAIVKTMMIIIVLVMIMTVVMVGCKEKEFTQDDLYNLASFKTESNEKSKDVTMTVKSGSTTIYEYKNGEETYIDGLESDNSFSLAGKGTGLEFKAEYFENATFTNSEGSALFKADIKDTKSFLKVSATNAKIEVSADSSNNRLNYIKISYDVEKNGTQYNVNINVTLKY